MSLPLVLCCCLTALMGMADRSEAGVKFTEGPADVTVAEGGPSAVLSCLVDGLDPALQVVAFERDRHVIADGTEVRQPILADLGLDGAKYRVGLDLIQPGSPERRYSLTVLSPGRRDAGSFRCLVCRKDPTGGACDANAVYQASATARLTVTYPPAGVYPVCAVETPVPVTNGSELVWLVEGKAAVFLCTAGESNPPVQLVWSRDGEAIPDQEETEDDTGQQASRLRLTVSGPRDNGTVLACSTAGPVYNGSSCQLPPLRVTADPEDTGGWSSANVTVMIVLAVIVVILLVAIVAAYVQKTTKGRRGSSHGHTVEYHPADTTD